MKHVTSKNERDRLLIEALIWKSGPLSCAEIHELTHLQRSEISRLTRELLKEGRLVQAGRADNPLGRKRLLLRTNEEQGLVLAVGFDDQDVVAATLDPNLQIRSEVRQAAFLGEGTEGLIGQLQDSARAALRAAGATSRRLLGVGVAGSGLINNRAGVLVMSSTIAFCRQVPLTAIFEKEFRVPTCVENLTRAKTLAEQALGAGDRAEDMIYVEYGRTGIGAGIIINSQLFYGSGYAAGEFGHTHMIEDGPACKCGSFGCLEAIAGAAALEARIRKALAEGSTSEALHLAAGDAARISGWTVLEAAGHGDKTCTAIVELAGNYLGLGLANLVNLFNTSVLVLDPRLEMAGHGLLDQITKIIKRQALNHSARDLAVKFGNLGNEAGILGAGLMVLEKHFEIPALKLPRFLQDAAAAPGRKAPPFLRPAPAPGVGPLARNPGK